MSGLWNFTLSTDNASGTNKDSAKIQGVEGQCLQGIKGTYKTNSAVEDFHVLKANTSPKELVELSTLSLHRMAGQLLSEKEGRRERGREERRGEERSQIVN